MAEGATDLVAALRHAGVVAGEPVALGWAPGVGAAVAYGGAGGQGASVALDAAKATAAVLQAEAELTPRWVVWSRDTASALLGAGARLTTCWDLTAVHRLLHGGWRCDPALVWAGAQGLARAGIPSLRPPDLFSLGTAGEDADDPVRPDGYLRPDWAAGSWADTPERLGRWAELALTVAGRQRGMVEALVDRPRATVVARAESATELLCAELAADGLPVDLGVAGEILAGLIGPRPRSDAEAQEIRDRRDAAVLAVAPAGGPVDLRSPAQVRDLLHRAGVDVPDTRAWRLRALGDTHPLVAALLGWRKAERIATTYGYSWLDGVAADGGRLRGEWAGSDGGAGRMTASGGLHNMPAELRPAVVAEPGHVFVHADLGQIEPRVLAAISGDAALAEASRAEDLYSPVAAQLGVDRPTAKVAVLGAMYGQTTGLGAQALRGLRRSYPVAIAYLEAADRSARAGHDLRTYGGRLVPMSSPGDGPDPEPVEHAAARGRYGRNAMVQGAAAELFKMWAVTVRVRSRPLGARIVLCLHDELLVHVPAESGGALAALLEECLREAVWRWAPDDTVHFVAVAGVIRRWSDAKA
jgi:DNA polymerase-1